MYPSKKACFSQCAPAAQHELPLTSPEFTLDGVLHQQWDSVSRGEISLATLRAKRGTIIPPATVQSD